MTEILEYVKSNQVTRNKIREELIELNKQNISTRAKKAEELTANLVVYNEAVVMMGDEIFELGVENQALRDQLGEVDDKWLNESKSRIVCGYNDEKKNKFILDRMRRQMKKLR